MRLLKDGISKGLKAFAVSVFLLGYFGEASQAQQTAPRASRYRLVDSLDEYSVANVPVATEEAPRLEFEDGEPESDFVTSADKVASIGLAPRSKAEAASGGSKAAIVAAGYLASAPKKAATKSRAKQTENWGHVVEHDAFSNFPITTPTEFPFVDQYRAFPPRDDVGMFYGDDGGSSWAGHRNSENFFGVDRRACCDEWGGFCPCVAADYNCGCGGLKANPGHCIFKRLSSGEPCEESYGCGIFSKCRCGEKNCQKGGCLGCGDKPEAGCASGCRSGGSAENPCNYKTATQRRCPLASSLLDKCKLKDQRPVKNVGPLDQACGCNECQSSCSD